MKFKLTVLAMFLVLSAGCGSKNYQDINNTISSQPLPVPEGEYTSVAWLDEDRIVFIYRPQELAANDMNIDFRIGMFEVSTGNTKELTSRPLISECYQAKRSKISNLSRLPDGSLGFIFNCATSGDSLYLLDPDSSEFVKRQTYLDFIAKDFSFSPDMSQLVQENGNGGGLSEKLLLVSVDGTMNELLPDFQRARSPAWSSDGKTIAFAGNQGNPNDSEIKTLQDIESLFLYPWDIYLMNADGSNPRVLLPSVGTIYGLKWSPTNESLLLFGGNSFDNKPGVWLLDISDMSVKRILNKNSNFDWSPDGSKIVLLDDATDVWWSSVAIINIANN